MGLMIANNYGFCLAQDRDMTNRPILGRPALGTN